MANNGLPSRLARGASRIPSNLRRYRVSRGDTVATIAARFGSTPREIVALNREKGVIEDGRRFDFLPGKLLLGDLLLVPAKKAGSPGRGRRPHTFVKPVRGRLAGHASVGCGEQQYGLARNPDGSCPAGFTPGATKCGAAAQYFCTFTEAGLACGKGGRFNVYGECIEPGGAVGRLADEDCGDGQHLVDFGDYVGCVSDNEGQPCGNGGTYDQYGDCQGGGGGGDDYTQYLSIPAVANAINAAKSGWSGDDYANSLSLGDVTALQAVCGILTALVSFATIGLGYPFVTAACKKAQQILDQSNVPPEEQPTYPQPCGQSPGDGFYILGPGQPCTFAGAGDSCYSENEKEGAWWGTFDAQGQCIYDGAKTANMGADCPAGYTAWRAPATNNSGWFCLGACGPNEELDLSDGLCACKSGFARDASGNCVKSTGNTNTNTQPKTNPPEKKPIPPENKPVPQNKPTTTTKEESNTGLYVAGALFAALAVGLGLKMGSKKK